MAWSLTPAPEYWPEVTSSISADDYERLHRKRQRESLDRCIAELEAEREPVAARLKRIDTELFHARSSRIFVGSED